MPYLGSFANNTSFTATVTATTAIAAIRPLSYTREPNASTPIILILITDNSLPILKVMMGTLTRAGFIVEQATNKLEAIETLKECTSDQTM